MDFFTKSLGHTHPVIFYLCVFVDKCVGARPLEAFRISCPSVVPFVHLVLPFVFVNMDEDRLHCICLILLFGHLDQDNDQHKQYINRLNFLSHCSRSVMAFVPS